jgi:hypothetical protein
MEVGTTSPGTLTEKGDLVRVATKGRDVFLDEGEGKSLIQQSEVAVIFGVTRGISRKAEY